MRTIPSSFITPEVKKPTVVRRTYLTPETLVPEALEDEDGFPNYFADLSNNDEEDSRSASAPIQSIAVEEEKRSASLTAMPQVSNAQDAFDHPENNEYSTASPVARRFWLEKKENIFEEDNNNDEASPVTKRFWLRASENVNQGIQKLKKASIQHSRRDILKQIS